MSSMRRKRVSISEMMKVPRQKPAALFGCRHVQVMLMTLGFFSCYATRVTTSVTLEAMTDSSKANPNFKEYAWENGVKNIILSSFFWGYICTQIPGSIIAQYWSAQKLFSAVLVICGVATAIIPLLADYGWEFVCAARVLAGLCQGCIVPTLHVLLSKWVPSEERGRLVTFVYSGGWIGNVICLLSSGFLSASVLGWPSCFYFWGSFTIAVSVTIFFFCKESPADDPNIPLDEREYIEVSLGVTETDEKLSTPWIAIMTSLPVWALLATQCAQAWGFWMLLTKIPSYMGSALGFNIQENGVVSSLPYLTAWILSFFFSYVSDICIKKNIITVPVSRKICNTIGQWLPAVALICLGYVDKDNPTLAVTILIIAVGTNIAAYCGHNVNHMDLSPNFAGPLMGITNTAANVCSILAPLIVDVVVKDPSDILQWRNIFFLSAGVYIMGDLIFILFGKAKVQRWNDPVNQPKTSTIYQIPEILTESNFLEDKKEEKTP